MRLISLPLLFGVLSVFSCSLNSITVQRLLIMAPPRPAVWIDLPSPLRYSVEWIDAEGDHCTGELYEGDSLEIRVPRGLPQAIIARPGNPFGTASSGFPVLFPAGALYPHELASGPLSPQDSGPVLLPLSWESGYCACVALAMERSGGEPWTYPLAQLKSAWARVADGPWIADPWIIDPRIADPWIVDPARIAYLLLEGRFRASVFRPPKFGADLPADSRWFPQSPLANIGSVEGIRKIVSGEGITLLFSDREILWLSFSADETHVVRYSP